MGLYVSTGTYRLRIPTYASVHCAPPRCGLQTPYDINVAEVYMIKYHKISQRKLLLFGCKRRNWELSGIS